MMWQAIIFGPDDTPWEGGTFKLVLEFTEDYPNKAPQVRFLTKMFHPNIYNDGQICLDILQNQWSPIYDISAILTSIQSLLFDPNPASRPTRRPPGSTTRTAASTTGGSGRSWSRAGSMSRAGLEFCFFGGDGGGGSLRGGLLGTAPPAGRGTGRSGTGLGRPRGAALAAGCCQVSKRCHPMAAHNERMPKRRRIGSASLLMPHHISQPCIHILCSPRSRPPGHAAERELHERVDLPAGGG